jgi:hypothetical protein
MSRFRKIPFTVVCIVPLLFSSPSFAEPPMNVDDAGTLDQGGMKVEGAWRKDDKKRGAEFVFGFSPLENLEIGIGLARDRDHADNPATRFNAVGVGFKWVPIQNKTGWSFGATLDFGRTRVNDYVTPDRFTEQETAINGLATWRIEPGNAVHLNLGAKRVKAQGQSDTLGTWGAGYEHPLVEKLKLTAEIFGEEHSRPDKAVGLRYEIVEGLKVSGAVGRGNGRSFGQVGFAWEF